jgi:hypothetical protein
MSAVEHKHPGYFLDGDNLRDKLDQPGDNEGSWGLGSGVSVRVEDVGFEV